MARYDALLKVLGAEKFNRLFAKVRPNIDYAVDDAMQPMRYFVDFTKAAKEQRHGSVGNRMVKVGQLVLFNGVAGYTKKHPNGMGSNYNVICSDATPGEQRYVGHGISSKGATEEELAQMMVDEYNEDPDHFIRVPDSRKREMQAVLHGRGSAALADHHVPSVNPLQSVSGFDRGSPQDFQAELVWDLLQIPVREVSMEYVEAHSSATRQYSVTREAADMQIMKQLAAIMAGAGFSEKKD